MSLDREEQMLVMQLADGELDEAERQRAMQLVDKKPEAAALLAEMGFVGDWARESQREGQKVIEVFDVAAEMEAQVSSRAPFSLSVNGPAQPPIVTHVPTSILVDKHEPHVLVDLDAQRRRRASRRTQTHGGGGRAREWRRRRSSSCGRRIAPRPSSSSSKRWPCKWTRPGSGRQRRTRRPRRPRLRRSRPRRRARWPPRRSPGKAPG